MPVIVSFQTGRDDSHVASQLMPLLPFLFFTAEIVTLTATNGQTADDAGVIVVTRTLDSTSINPTGGQVVVVKTLTSQVSYRRPATMTSNVGSLQTDDKGDNAAVKLTGDVGGIWIGLAAVVASSIAAGIWELI